MSYEMKGNVIELYDVQQVSAKFKKREFVLQVQDGAYEQNIIFQCMQDKTELLNGVQIGDEITVFFNINGKGWSKTPNVPLRYFNNLNCWKIEKDNTRTPQNSGFGEPITIPQKQDDFVSDDLPF